MSDDKILEKKIFQGILYKISFMNKLFIFDYLIKIISYSFLLGICLSTITNTIFTCELNKKIQLFDFPGNKIFFYSCTSIAFLFLLIKNFKKIHKIFNKSESLLVVDDKSKDK